ncbi:hypothetical protein llap_17225 [Limosa lapponica baueri]|uniref:Uncharacterized protein n=1 Tax=Limosa lapponica baueri TaxID=1758121 RepID=A0A2I0TF88_LIMLA|nr:hypothetical protein llap_17225 [Limosa lapponica baueri]
MPLKKGKKKDSENGRLVSVFLIPEKVIKKVTEPWHRLSERLWNLNSWRYSKAIWDMVLSNQLQVALAEQGRWTR